MNNYIDERFIPYKRPATPVNRANQRIAGRPLTRNTRKRSAFVKVLKAVAFIFLLLLSTFGGEKNADGRKYDSVAEKAVKKCLVYIGVLLALWGALIIVSKVTAAVAFLPLWCLIGIFALTLLGAAGIIK